MAYTNKLTNTEILTVVYYLLLQDRIPLAKNLFSRISVPATSTASSSTTSSTSSSSSTEIGSSSSSAGSSYIEVQMQYDYIAAYLDFYNDTPKVATAIAEKYAKVELPNMWRKLFDDIRDQLKEIEVTEAEEEMEVDDTEFDFEVQDNQIIISYEEIYQCKVQYYKMDIELLFSTSPFVQQNLGNFSFIMPNLSAVIDLPKDSEMHKIELPKECRNTNVMIEFTAGKITKVKPHFSHNLFTKLFQKNGIIKACSKESGKPLAKTYIKVFAKLSDDSVVFYKDGYTDLRGKFDYVSLSHDADKFIDKFSILVMSTSSGTTIVEANPPNKQVTVQKVEGYLHKQLRRQKMKEKKMK